MLFRNHVRATAIGLAVAAALLYNSWPLGYWLNPASADKSASQLEGLHQPYNWLFVGLDIASGVLALALSIWLWRTNRRSRWLAAVLICVAAFGMGTIVAALVPVHCATAHHVCPSFTQAPYLIVHALASVASALALSLALLLVWWCNRHDRIVNLLLLAGIISGATTAYEMLAPGRDGGGEKVYLTICSLWLALLPVYIYRLAAYVAAPETDKG